jgi:hypothetical protein
MLNFVQHDTGFIAPAPHCIIRSIKEYPAMQRFSLRPIACITLLAALALFQQQIQAQSSAPTGAPAGQQLTAYLPMLLAVGVPNPAPQPPASAGFFALTYYLTYSAATVIDAQGVVHLAFFASDERHRDAPLGQPAFYTSCAVGAAACGDPQHWTSLVQIDSAVNEVQIAVTSDGRPRLLLRLNGARGYDYHYWGCEGQCGNAEQWAGAYITNVAGVELRNADLPQHSFTYLRGWQAVLRLVRGERLLALLRRSRSCRLPAARA